MAQALTQEELKNEIIKTLENMGCTNILFLPPKEDRTIVVFDCKELTSFKMALSGWTYSGIQLDPTNTRQYKIDFIKLK